MGWDYQNRAPDAVNDNNVADTYKNEAITINVSKLLANDTDFENNVLVFVSVTSPSVHGGTIVDNQNGTITYTPDSGYDGSDSFAYTINDQANGGQDTTPRVDLVQAGPEIRGLFSGRRGT